MTTGMQRIPGPRYKHVADDDAPYETITIDKLTPIIGAEIGGVDLSKPLSNRTPTRSIARLPKTSSSSSATSISRRSSIWRSAGCSATCTSIRPRRTRRAIRN